MMLQLLHDCRLFGQTVRHRTPIDYREVKLNSGHLRLEGTRCDGTPIEAYANRNGNTLVAYNENVDSHDPDRNERTMCNTDTGEQWVSRHYGPWTPISEFDEPTGPMQDVLFGGAA